LYRKGGTCFVLDKYMCVQAMRLKLSEASSRLEAAESDLAAREGHVAEQQRIIAGLEEDLMAAEQAGAGASEGAEANGATYISQLSQRLLSDADGLALS
jgi:hypothetical protein